MNGTTVKRHVDSIKARHCTNSNANIVPEEDDTFQLIPSANLTTTSTNEPVPTDNTVTETVSPESPDQSEIEDLLQDLMTMFRLKKLQSFRRERCSNLTCKDRHLLSSISINSIHSMTSLSSYFLYLEIVLYTQLPVS